MKLLLFLVLPSVASRSLGPLGQKGVSEHTKECLLLDVHDMIQNRSHSGKSSTMVQIGAHLAWENANDPFGMLSRDTPMLRTLLIEPQPNVFKQLNALLSPGGRTTARNYAVCPESHADRNVTFYAISDALDTRTGKDTAAPKRQGAWFASQIASLNKSHILKHSKWIPDIEDYIVEIQVPCFTVMSLVENEKIAPSDVAVLTIDAEGYDGKILETVDFVRMRPYLVVWEFMHLFNRCDKCGIKHCEDAQYCGHVLRTIESHGYQCWYDAENMYCTNPPDTCRHGGFTYNRVANRISGATAPVTVPATAQADPAPATVPAVAQADPAPKRRKVNSDKYAEGGQYMTVVDGWANSGFELEWI